MLAVTSNSYQIMECSRHSDTENLNDYKEHAAITSKLFKRLVDIKGQLYEKEIMKSEFEPKEPIILDFLILQYCKLRMFKLYQNISPKFCDE